MLTLYVLAIALILGGLIGWLEAGEYWAKMGNQWSLGPPELPGAKWRARPTDPPPQESEP